MMGGKSVCLRVFISIEFIFYDCRAPARRNLVNDFRVMDFSNKWIMYRIQGAHVV